VRGALESLAARLAASRATTDQRGQLSELASSSLAAARDHDVDGFRRCDEEFHDVLAAASANPYLARLIDNAYALTSTARQRDVPSAGESVDCATGHVQVAEAIAHRDPELAAAEIIAHVEMVGQLVLRAFLDQSTAHIPVSANERVENG
jgi:DNA-binding GntR family transcriptional regulator